MPNKVYKVCYRTDKKVQSHSENIIKELVFFADRNVYTLFLQTLFPRSLEASDIFKLVLLNQSKFETKYSNIAFATKSLVLNHTSVDRVWGLIKLILYPKNLWDRESLLKRFNEYSIKLFFGTLNRALITAPVKLGLGENWLFVSLCLFYKISWT